MEMEWTKIVVNRLENQNYEEIFGDSYSGFKISINFYDLQKGGAGECSELAQYFPVLSKHLLFTSLLLLTTVSITTSSSSPSYSRQAVNKKWQDITVEVVIKLNSR